MADEYTVGQSPRLGDVLAHLSAADRRALLQHVEAGRAHAEIVAERLRAAEASEPVRLREAETHLLVAICHLELAAGALGLAPEADPPPRRWWQRLVWWR